MVSLVIADSNQLSRFGLVSVLAADESLQISGEAADEASLLDHLKHFNPEIVVIDYTAPGFSIDSVVKCLSQDKNIRIVAITPEQSAVTLVNAMKAGVMSYVKKDCSLQEIADSIKSTARGERFFCGQILETIRTESIDVDDSDLAEFTCEPINLTTRELEIIGYIAEGYTNTQIAEKLFLSGHTVSTHRKNIMQKLGVNNTASIVMYAVKSRLVSPNKFLFAPNFQ